MCALAMALAAIAIPALDGPAAAAGGPVDLSAYLSDSGTPSVVGEQTYFYASAYNWGPAGADHLTYTFNVPAVYAIGSTEMTSQGCVVSGQTATCDVGTVAASAWAPSVHRGLPR